MEILCKVVTCISISIAADLFKVPAVLPGMKTKLYTLTRQVSQPVLPRTNTNRQHQRAAVDVTMNVAIAIAMSGTVAVARY